VHLTGFESLPDVFQIPANVCEKTLSHLNFILAISSCDFYFCFKFERIVAQYKSCDGREQEAIMGLVKLGNYSGSQGPKYSTQRQHDPRE
jgi:hypothetical protein